MRKHILPRLRTLLSAACATIATGKVQPKPAAPRLEPDTLEHDQISDTWLFESETRFETVRLELSKDMTGIADSLSDLRETLSLIHGETPFPVEATTQRPCAIVHHDDMLFEGEVEAPYMPAQEEVSGGEGVFLFGDAPTFQDEVQEHQQHAA